MTTDVNCSLFESAASKRGDEPLSSLVIVSGLYWRLPVGRPLEAARGETTSNTYLLTRIWSWWPFWLLSPTNTPVFLPVIFISMWTMPAVAALAPDEPVRLAATARPAAARMNAARMSATKRARLDTTVAVMDTLLSKRRRAATGRRHCGVGAPSASRLNRLSWREFLALRRRAGRTRPWRSARSGRRRHRPGRPGGRCVEADLRDRAVALVGLE